MFYTTIARGWLALAIVASAVTVQADVFNLPSGQTSLQFVTVGDPGNVADSAMDSGTGTTTSPGSGLGAVAYNYQMGKYDVTLAQYTAFLTAVAQTDAYGLYGGGMGNATQGISRTGSSGSYSYSVTGSNPQAANCPISGETWGDAARFCNWLQNGQPTGVEGNGTTETGAYTLSGATTALALVLVTRNAGATYFIPPENDWYRAAYYKAGGTNAGYWTYPMQSNTTPGNSLALATSTSNEANFAIGTNITDPTNRLTPVGAFSASPGPYGTFDMGGDLFQWNETVNGLSRGDRGGFWFANSSYLLSSYRDSGNPAFQNLQIGFRVESSVAVPEPGSLALLLSSAVGLLAFAWRRRTHAP